MPSITTISRNRAASFLVAFVSMLIAACGGGGGSAVTPPTGTLTLSANSASFTSFHGETAPGVQTFTVTLSGSAISSVSTSFPTGQQPSWLSVSVSGTGATRNLSVVVTPAALDVGTVSTTFNVSASDSDGALLSQQSFSVSLQVGAPITIATAPITASLAFGDTAAPSTGPIAVTAANRSWRASSDAAWLQVPTTVQSGSGPVAATYNDAGLAPGTYTGHVAVVNSADSADRASLTVTLTVTPASLTASTGAVTFGGTNGLASLTPTPVQFSLSTGKGMYPFSIALTTVSGGNWLTVDNSTGTVGSTGTVVNLGINRAAVRGGTYAGQVTMTATVNGTPFVASIAVTLNLEANRILVTASGVGLSQVGGTSVLTRTVQVLSGLGRTDLPWTASSDSPWLTVTGSGTTGGNLVIQASPGTLPSNATQFANVTVSSPDPTVENQQTIRVGLYLSSTAATTTTLSVAGSTLATSPVEPIVAIGTGGTDVQIYNVYSGALVRTLASVAGATGPMVFSEDGRTLFVYDSTNLAVKQVDSGTGAQVATYPSPVAVGFGASGDAIGVMHPNGYPMLVTPVGLYYDLTTGKPFTDNVNGSTDWMSDAFSFATTPDQSLLAAQDGTTIRVTRSSLNGGVFVTQKNIIQLPVNTVENSSNGQSCFSTTGDRLYTASGAPYDFPATSVATSQIIQVLPGTNYPDAIQCVWNGLVIGGVDGYYSNTDIFVYFGLSGVSLGQLSSNGLLTGYRDLLSRGLAVSADGTMLVSAWATSPGNSSGAGVYFQPLPVP
jgi:hypothetical protein